MCTSKFLYTIDKLGGTKIVNNAGYSAWLYGAKQQAEQQWGPFYIFISFSLSLPPSLLSRSGAKP